MALKAVLILATVGLVYSQGHTAALLVAEPTMEGTAPAVTKPSTNATSPTPTINSTRIPWKSASSSVTCLPALMPVTGSSTTEQEAWTRTATCLDQAMSQYLGSCNMVGGALRNSEDKCIEDVPYCTSAGICPGGCAKCDTDDICNGYVETGCTKKGTESSTSTGIPTIEGCYTVMTSQGPSAQVEADEINFYFFDKRAELCKGYPPGERDCTSSVVDQTMPLETIKQCRNE